MHSAKEHADRTHRIPLNGFNLSTNNYKKLVEDMKQILEESRFTNQMTGKPTPMLVFCREDAIEQNRGVFQWLQQKYNEIMKTSFEWDLEVLDLVLLLYYISKSGGHTISMAAGEVNGEFQLQLRLCICPHEVLHFVNAANRYHQNVGTDNSQWNPNQDMADEEEANSPIPQTGIGRGRPNASKPQNNPF
ncbi:unnamed protein product [Oppiella nova]|uniref:Maelstrom domain-containing protein n=1 Tax=Oppiella nova TaxID=334625 RepID=A0A7R9QDP0_9ACAR|nr:unnamed protein product [Oppiella nova]CAG2163243.1 unnamed protein product [Oppiella nova]